MRPTELQYKHPKESTPDCYDLNFTADGRALNFPSPAIFSNDSKTKITTFSKGDRFPQYKFWAKINI